MFVFNEYLLQPCSTEKQGSPELKLAGNNSSYRKSNIRKAKHDVMYFHDWQYAEENSVTKTWFLSSIHSTCHQFHNVLKLIAQYHI